MKRLALDYLQHWLTQTDRKPLILRGARQVGKTWLVRELAAATGKTLIEINFEKEARIADTFLLTDVRAVITQLELTYNQKIDATNTILFLDEVQSKPEVIKNLRWFYEDMPELAVVCAGSLLDFALNESSFSMPVGRVTYMYVEPMSFREFLWAKGESLLADFLPTAMETLEIPPTVHEKLTRLFHEYCIIGGFPAAVQSWCQSHDGTQCWKIHADLLASFEDDFNKYRGRTSADVLRQTLYSVPQQLGSRFMYSNVAHDEKNASVKKALRLLVYARLCTKVSHTAANGLPLGAETKDEIFKVGFVDTGLALHILGLRPVTERDFEALVWANKGALAEQMVCQGLCAGFCPEKSAVFYWQRIGSATGEIDFLLQKEGGVLPIEVKAGASGSMKSLHAFVHEKKLSRAVRFDMNPPSRQRVEFKTTQGAAVSYDLLNYPLYLAEFVSARCPYIQSNTETPSIRSSVW